MPNLDSLKSLIESIESERIEREIVRKYNADASGELPQRALFPVTNAVAIAVLGVSSAIAAFVLNYVVIVIVFHLSFG